MLRIGIVGCGHVAKHHARLASGLGDCRVVGLADTNLNNARRLAQECATDNYHETLQELLSSTPLDVLHVVTPPAHHYAHARMAIEQGVHVLIEKPMTLRSSEVLDLYARATCKRVTVCPDFNQLFHPCMSRAIALIRSGELGPMVHCEAHLTAEWDVAEMQESVDLHWPYRLPGGVLHNYVTHPLYLVLYWLGKPKRIVVAHKALGILPQGLTDHLDILLEGARMTGHVTLSFGTRRGGFSVRLFCRNGTVTVNFETRTVQVDQAGRLPRAISRATANFRQAYELSNTNLKNLIDMVRGKLVPYEGLQALLRANYASIRNHGAPPISPELAIAVSEAEEAVISQSGKVQVDLRPRRVPQPRAQNRERVLVTGATGYLGAEIVRHLVEAGYYVRALARPISHTEKLDGLEIDLAYADVRDYPALLIAFDDIDVVVHAAAGMKGSPSFIMDSCVRGTDNVAKAAKAAGVKRVVYISSMSVYDFVVLRKGARVTEETPLEQFPELRGVSSMAKREAENIALAQLADIDTPWTILRPSFLIGNERDVLAPFGPALGNIALYFGSSRTRLRLVHVRDIAIAVLKTIQSPGTSGHVFVLSQQKPITAREYLQGFVRKSNRKNIRVLYVPRWVAGLGRIVLGIRRQFTHAGPFLSRQRVAYLYSDVLVDSSSFIAQTGWSPDREMKEHLTREIDSGHYVQSEREIEIAVKPTSPEELLSRPKPAMGMKAKRLIINADDFGLSYGITDGILRAHREGIVTSTSLMVNQSASEYAIAQIPHVPKLSVGVHLNICEGKPVLPPDQVPSLIAKNGMFLAPDLMIRKLWRCQVSFREIEAEFRAQIRWMKDRGVNPTHADSHRHMHHYPGAILSFYRALVKEGIRSARGLRHRASPNNGVVGGPYSGSVLRRMAISAYSDLFQGIVLRKLFFPDSCIVLHPRYRGKLELLTDGWTAILESLPAGSYELGCHPGLSEPGFSENDEYRERREIELETLTKPRLRSTVERNQIELITYPQL